MPVEKLISNSPSGVLVRKLQGLRAKPLDAHDSNNVIRENASDRGVRLKVFETCHGRTAY